jgi:hypothetical protein
MEVGVGTDGSEDGPGDGSTGTEGEGIGKDGKANGDGTGDWSSGTEGDGMGNGGTSTAKADVVMAKTTTAAVITLPAAKPLSDT